MRYGDCQGRRRYPRGRNGAVRTGQRGPERPHRRKRSRGEAARGFGFRRHHPFRGVSGIPGGKGGSGYHPCPDHPSGGGSRRLQSPHRPSGGQNRRGICAGGHGNRCPDLLRLDASGTGRGIQSELRGVGAGDFLPLRVGTGNPCCHHGGHGAGRPVGRPIQERTGAGKSAPGGYRGAGQNRNPYHRKAGGDRHPARRDWGGRTVIHRRCPGNSLRASLCQGNS